MARSLELTRAMMEAQGTSPTAVRASVRPCSRLQRLIAEATETERRRETPPPSVGDIVEIQAQRPDLIPREPLRVV